MTTSLVVFLVYFGVIAVLGVVSARATRNERDYWIAGGKLGWLSGGATLAATHASAGTFVGTVGVMYATGWSFTWLILSLPIAYWILARFLAPRLAGHKYLTLPAFLEDRYQSPKLRALAAAITLIATVVYVQAQIIAGGLITNVVFGIDATTGMLIFGVILIVYTMVGGMLAVVYTDVLQLCVMFGAVLIATPLAISKLGGLGATIELALVERPELLSWSAMPASLLLTMGLAFTLGSIATPEKVVRLFAMKDLPTIRRGVLVAIVATTAMNFLVLLLGLVGIVHFPDLATGDLVMPTVAQNVLPAVLGAVLLAAITAAMMSTVDSMLLVAGSALARDLFGTLRPSTPERTLRLLDRLGIVLVGVVPIALTLGGVGAGELIQFIVILFSALMAASFFAPVVIGLYWKRANATGAAAAMTCGVLTTFGWKLYGLPIIDPVLPGVAASVLALVVGSLATGAKREGGTAASS